MRKMRKSKETMGWTSLYAIAVGTSLLLQIRDVLLSKGMLISMCSSDLRTSRQLHRLWIHELPVFKSRNAGEIR